MAIARSAGALLFRITASDQVEVLLGHMGGPFSRAPRRRRVVDS
jgi:predicted NUDIX family NTP pyrophosphohydrolase